MDYLPVKKEAKVKTETTPIEMKYITMGSTPKSMPLSARMAKSDLIQATDNKGNTEDKSRDGKTELIGDT